MNYQSVFGGGWSDTISEAPTHYDEYYQGEQAPRIVELDDIDELAEELASIHTSDSQVAYTPRREPTPPPTYAASNAVYSRPASALQPERDWEASNPFLAPLRPARQANSTPPVTAPAAVRFTQVRPRQQHTAVVREEPTPVSRRTTTQPTHTAAQEQVPTVRQRRRSSTSEQRDATARSATSRSSRHSSRSSVVRDRRHGLRITSPTSDEIRTNPALAYLFT